MNDKEKFHKKLAARLHGPIADMIAEDIRAAIAKVEDTPVDVPAIKHTALVPKYYSLQGDDRADAWLLWQLYTAHQSGDAGVSEEQLLVNAAVDLKDKSKQFRRYLASRIVVLRRRGLLTEINLPDGEGGFGYTITPQGVEDYEGVPTL